MAFKQQLVFGGKPEMSVQEAITYGQDRISRFFQGELTALYDVWYIVNVLGVPLDALTNDPVRIANSCYYNRLETLV